MTKHISRTALIVFGLYAIFAAIIVYILQARFTEKPSILVDHYMAGAGNLLQVLLCPLTIVVSLVPAFLWSNTPHPKGRGLLWAALILPPVIMVATVFNIERRATQFDYETFAGIIADYESGSVITQEQALELLGPPLSQEQVDGREVWSYTYMPSTGLGWHKRVLSFAKSGQMIGYVDMDEP